MNIRVELSPEMEARLNTEARAKGLPVERLAEQLLKSALTIHPILNPETFRDQSTFAKPLVPSTGVRYLLVNANLVIDGGAIVPGVAPGRALVGPSIQ